VRALVDKERREATRLHHSAAHLFHAAIRQLLGKQVAQAGSQVGPEAMRFDFNYERQLTPKEIMAVENLMNEWVRQNAPVVTEEMPIEEAKQTGAVAMFGEKYGDVVRVLRMGDFSLEFCGGTHVSNTGEIGPIKIISEGSISSGTRRVEALAGPKAWNHISQFMNILNGAAGHLKIRPEELLDQIERLQDQIKQKEKLAQTLSDKLALSHAADLLARAETVGDIQFIGSVLDDLSGDALKTLADNVRQQKQNIVIALATKLAEDKVSIAVGVSDPLVKKGINAGNLVKEAATICGGGGGGRPQLAQAGGKDPSKLDKAIAAVKAAISTSFVL
jgi:alanyl-tRNA synthetase